MKFSLLTLSSLTLALTASAAPSPKKDYWIQVIGGNPTINGQNLRFNGTQSPSAVSPGPYNIEDHAVRIRPDASIHQFFIVPTHPHPPPVPGYLALIGPSGKGDMGLQATWNPTPGGIGSQVDYKDWRVVTAPGGKDMLLRYKDEACQSHWIAVPQKVNGKTKWVPYWYRPFSGNMGDFPSFVMIDLKIVEAPPGENLGGKGGRN